MNVEGLYLSYLKTIKSLGLSETKMILCASITSQKLYLMQKGEIVKEYTMSTSRKPPSCVENSLGTPWGLHEVCEKIGEGEEIGMVFVGRKPIGDTYSTCEDGMKAKNLITTRILRLRGLEDGVNRGNGIDSYDRYIYIHGTNHEDRIGSPSSSGCLQLANQDVLQLHDLAEEGMHLWIENVNCD
jgi:hypothetical protein